MKNGKFQIFFFLLFIYASGIPSLQAERRDPDLSSSNRKGEILQRTVNFLLSKQNRDGSWRSETYGLLKSGQSLTPFILDALSDFLDRDNLIARKSIRQAMQFIRKNTNKEGILGKSDPDLLDYPNYSTAYGLKCFLKFGNHEDQPRILRMIRYLKDQQFSEKNGFAIDSSPYGGWGFGVNQKPSLASFVDLAHTRRVLEALCLADSITDDMQNRACIFLNRLQKRNSVSAEPNRLWISSTGYDGGFFSSTNIAYANKGRDAIHSETGKTFFRSYSTATCDGLLSLIALGEEADSEQFQDAKEWLLKNKNWNLPAGIPLDDPAPWAESMYFYNLMVLSEAHVKLELSGNWKKKLLETLSQSQLANGSFVNLDGRLMKEDDPLISSAYAVKAMNF